VVLAIVISLVALWLTFRFREDMKDTGWRKIASALVMGAAIPVMHYSSAVTPMSAKRLSASPNSWATRILPAANRLLWKPSARSARLALT